MFVFLQPLSSDCSLKKYDVGKINWVYHRIHTNNERLIKQAVRRLTPEILLEVEKHLKEMLALGQIRPSQSPWASPIVLVTEKQNKTNSFLH